MERTILEIVKEFLAILYDNIAFDSEILAHINGACGSLAQLGVTELDIPINESTEYPTFGSMALNNLVRLYILLKVKRIFDATASETIAKAFDQQILELEGRIMHEVEDIANP